MAHARTKHIEIDIHFIHDQMLAHQLDIRYIPSIDQLVDCFTNPLHLLQFKYLHDKLDLSFFSARLRGGHSLHSLN